MKRRILALLLLVACLLPMLSGLPRARAAGSQTKRAISVVFDNSGSMYMASYDPKAWCRATYAMEVFASMMNEGDVMQIHPMNDAYLEVGSFGYGKGEAYIYGSNPLVINGPKDAQKIRNLYLDGNAGTPIESIPAAYKALQKMDADEKYLIVLSDGAVFYEYGAEMDQARTKTRLTEELNKCTGVNVMFLGIGNATEPDGNNDADRYYRVARDSADVLKELTVMCNRIFGRDELKDISNTIQLDISMKKLIVFAQGGQVTDVSFNGGTRTSFVNTRYSECGIMPGLYDDEAEVDYTLQGVIATYENIKSGSYSFSLNGSYDSLNVYYEPGVELKIDLLDGSGKVVDPSGEIYPGDYVLDYCLIDSVTGERITDQSLLGQVDYKITLTRGGQPQTQETSEPGQIPISLQAGDVLDGAFFVRYLEDYTIDKTGKNYGWPAGGITVAQFPVGQLALSISGGAPSFPLTKLEEQPPFLVQVTYDGQLLTGAALDPVADLQVSLSGGNAQYRVERSQDGFLIYILSNGSIQDTQAGSYTMLLNTSYTTPEGLSAVAPEAKTEFIIEDDGGQYQVELELPQKYYAKTQMKDAKPVYINLSFQGQPLSQQRFADTKLELKLGNLEKDKAFALEAEPENSRYVLRLINSKDLTNGKHKLTAKVEGADLLGRTVTAQATAKLEVQPYPAWLVVLFWILVVLAVIGLIWAYLNMKILPKQIGVGKGTFSVEGELIPGSVRCSFSGKNRKRGSIEVTSPQCMTNPMAKCGFRLELEAISPRRTRSASRRARVVGISPLNPVATTSLVIGSWRMAKDPVSNKLVKVGGKPDTPIDFNIGNNCATTVVAEILDLTDGGEIACSLTVPLKFF